MHSVVHLFLYLLRFPFVIAISLSQVVGFFPAEWNIYLSWIYAVDTYFIPVNRRRNQPGLEHLLLVRKMKRDITWYSRECEAINIINKHWNETILTIANFQASNKPFSLRFIPTFVKVPTKFSTKVNSSFLKEKTA